MSDASEKPVRFSAVAAERPREHRARFHAAAIFDAGGPVGSAMLVEWGQGPLPRVLAVGTPTEVDSHPGAAGAEAVDLPHAIITPGFVNAHTHLDLTHVGPQPHHPASGFLPWVEMIRAGRRQDAAGIAESVYKGVELSLAGGTVALGDIAGGAPGEAGFAAWNALRQSPLLGTSFLEVFGIGNRRQSGVDRLEALAPALAAAAAEPVRLGIQPHAPYSVDRRVYAEAARIARQAGAPLATHLAESPEEDQMVRDARGPFRDLLERLDLWDESVCDFLGKGEHPARHLESILAAASFLVAHINDASDGTIGILARANASVAYCPRASAYFGAPRVFGAHRYQEMLAAGVNVALGTDSLVNLPAAGGGAGRLSVWDEACMLYRRDRTSPLTLLAMATINGARALRLPEAWFTIRPGGELAGAAAVPLDPGAGNHAGSTLNTPLTELEWSLRGGGSPRLLFIRTVCCWAGQAPLSSPTTLSSISSPP